MSKVLAVVVLSILALYCIPGFAEAFQTLYANTKVSIYPGDLQVQCGQSFQIYVNATDVVKLQGFDFMLKYDSNVIRAVSVEEGTFLSSAGTTFVAMKQINNNFGGGFGRVWFAVALLGTAYVNGSGVLAVITFNATYGGESVLDLYSDFPYDANHVKLTTCTPTCIGHVVIDGHVLVTCPTPPPMCNVTFLTDPVSPGFNIIFGGVTYHNGSVGTFPYGTSGYATATSAGGELKLPSTLVKIEVRDGTKSHFNTTLSNVPSGYAVENSSYLGWCVDVRTDLPRSPAKHEVKLYSTLAPPAPLAHERWDMVNYILNHKQGTKNDVQQAIWYFVHMNGAYTPTRTIAMAIVNDALAHGDHFVPGKNQTVAVICYPTILYPAQCAIQISIIEVANTQCVFDHWEATGNVEVSSTTTNPTTVTIKCGGTLKAVCKYVDCPCACFTAKMHSPRVTFNASASFAPDGQIVTYTWDFGDGNTTTLSSPTVIHDYAAAGTYNVTLTVVDEFNLRNSTEKILEISMLTGDFNDDEVINIIDITMIARVYGLKLGEPDFKDVFDLDDNGVINIIDITVASVEFGRTE